MWHLKRSLSTTHLFFVNIRATVEKFVNITQSLAGIVPARKHILRGVKKGFA